MLEKKISKGKIMVNIITLSVFVIGLILLIRGIKMDVPDMGKNHWMAKRSSRTFHITFGVFLTMVGIMSTIAANLISKLPRISRNIIHTSMNTIEDINERVVEMRKKHMNINKSSCDYCGTKFDSSSSKCPNCGAPNQN